MTVYDATPVLELLKIADDKTTVGELRSLLDKLFPDGLNERKAIKVDVSYKDVTPKEEPKPSKAQRKPRAEKAPSEVVENALELITRELGAAQVDGVGMRFENLATVLKPVSPHVVKRAIALGESRKSIRREGNKRATTYFLV